MSPSTFTAQPHSQVSAVSDDLPMSDRRASLTSGEALRAPLGASPLGGEEVVRALLEASLTASKVVGATIGDLSAGDEAMGTTYWSFLLGSVYWSFVRGW